jgi:hypothetical protein
VDAMQEQQVCIKFCGNIEKESAAETLAMLTQAFGE